MFSCNLNQFLTNMAASKLTAYCVEKKTLSVLNLITVITMTI
jgi:hypothetical protein